MFSIKIPGETKVITYENFNKRANYSLSVARYFIKIRIRLLANLLYLIFFISIT